MKKLNKVTAVILSIGLFATGCTAKETVQTEEKPITLTICIAESQWDQTIDGLTELYLKEHPRSRISSGHWSGKVFIGI